MMTGLWTGATGMGSQQLNVDTIANNLANVQTAGFKQSRANFQDLMYHTVQLAGATTAGGGQIPTGIQIGMGVKPSSVQKIFTQGNIQETGNQLDMLIQGDGFFKVLQGTEELYTRAGNFTLDSDGYITTSLGARLQPEITIPAEANVITLQPDGTMTIYGSSEDILATEQVYVYSFVNSSGLNALGQSLFRPTEGSGDSTENIPGSDGSGIVANNAIELSNVSVVNEMVTMIAAQRAYEANSKTVQTADTMLGIANGLKR